MKKSSHTLKTLQNKIKIYKGFKNDFELESMRLKKVPCHITLKELEQGKILENDNSSFLLSNDKICEAIENSKYTLGDLADCVTGIYCGDNKRFLYFSETNGSTKKGYDIAELTKIDFTCKDLTGVKQPYKYVPIIKGSSKTKFLRESDEWVIDWSHNAINHYNNDKKARFQNSKYYFKTGIAIPMVKSANIKATIMQDSVFDQSIVGIFAKNEKLIYFILAYLNSKVANDFIHTINPTANNSANYLKKLPIFMPTEDEINYINHLVDSIFRESYSDEKQKDIDNFFQSKLINKL